MSDENHGKERVLDSSEAEESGNEGIPISWESLTENSEVPTLMDGADGASDEGLVMVTTESVNRADLPDAGNQKPSSPQVEQVDRDGEVLLIRTNSLLDGGREDMFVDCPDELVVYDGRNIDNSEAMAIPETHQSSKETDDKQETVIPEMENGSQVHESMNELQHLKDMLAKTVNEKESLAREYKEERGEFMKQLTYLHNQLKALNEQRSFLDENDGDLGESLQKAETGGREEKTLKPDIPPHEMLIECSRFLEDALNGRLHNEGRLGELQTALLMKDQEIDSLHAMVNELSVSQDVVVSFMRSTEECWSESLKASSKVQFEEDEYMEATANRLLTSLVGNVTQEVFDESITGKIYYVEKSISLLLEKNNQFLSEIELLRQCLTESRSDLSVQDEYQTIFSTAREELLELKRKEADLAQKMSHLDDENRKLMEQLDKDKETIETANAEIGKLKLEVEQEKTKFANTKEKLSMAVTKGKALVQQRDSLKHSLAEKTSELEKCLFELQEKSNILQAAALSKDELVESRTLADSLQEALSQRDTILGECEEILSQSGIPGELQSLDFAKRIRWLVDEMNVLKEVSTEFHKLDQVLSSINFPENVSFSNLESRVTWVVESQYLAQAGSIKLQDEIARTQEAAKDYIDRLTTSFLVELLETYYLQEDMEDFRSQLEEAVGKEHRVSMEKDQMISMLLEASGMSVDNQEEIYNLRADVSTLIDRCFSKIKEQGNVSLELSRESEMFDRLQSLLYVRDLELVLHERMLEEEMMDRLEVNSLTNELRVVSEELKALKDEKGSLQKDFERAEEKSALLREKLSMAVKKGKGLVQERENLKKVLDERNAEIKTLKLELQQQESAYNECNNQLNNLSSYVERIPTLEADLAAMKDQRDQFEHFLVESNTMLQRMIESIDGIALPVDLTFEEPIEKVKWLGEYLSDCLVAKTQAEQELEKIEVEADTLASKLTESYKTMKSLEDALSKAESNISELVEEKRELEACKSVLEQELQKAMAESSSQAGKFTEVGLTMKSLQDALSEAENNISLLINEKEDAHLSRAAAETELEKVREDVSVQTSKLAEAYRTIKSLEDGMSELEANVSTLAAENTSGQVVRTSLENELKRLKEETDSLDSKLADANSIIKLREDELLKAQHSISEQLSDKRNAEEEISTLNSKLSACMEELAGTHGSIESRFVELSGHLNSFQLFLKDGSLLSLLRKCFGTNFESLKNVDFLLKNIKGQLDELDSELLQNCPVVKDDPFASKLFSSDHDDIVNVEMDINVVNAADGGDILSNFGKTLEGFHVRDKILADGVERFSTSFDEVIAVLSAKVQGTWDYVSVMLEHINSLKHKVNSLEDDRQDQENTIVMLRNDISVLASACSGATKELEIEVENIPMDPKARELDGDATYDHQQGPDGDKYVKTAEKLLFTARKVRSLTKQFQDDSSELASEIGSLQKLLQQTRTNLETATEERDSNQSRISMLEHDVADLQILCNEMSSKVEDYQAKEDKLKEREAELMYNMSSRKDNGAEENPLSAVQVKALFDKINRTEVPFPEFEEGETELEDSINVRRLFYIIDAASTMQHQLNLLSVGKEELQSSLAKQDLEIKHLKKEVEEQMRNKQDYETMRSELIDLVTGLESLIKKLGGFDLIADQNGAGVRGLLPVLEKLVSSAILESEVSKSKAQELGVKLLGSQKFVDELSTKVKLLEDSSGRAVIPENIQDRSIFEQPSLPTRSEISEVEDVGSSVKNAISPAPSAAHVRTLRKGSNEHLAINIDSESNRLLNSEDTDEDKGHIFKSLNTSGLIPRQGKMVADRVDGIWVSGGRALMSRPRARLGLIAYWLLLHLWLLGTIL